MSSYTTGSVSVTNGSATVTGDVTDEYLTELEARRNDAAKRARKKSRKKGAKVVSL